MLPGEESWEVGVTAPALRCAGLTVPQHPSLPGCGAEQRRSSHALLNK